MEIDILTLLKNCPLFSALDDESLKKLLRKFRKIQLCPDEILFRQGEPSTGIYLLVTGSINLYASKENQEESFISRLGPGQTIGELSALSGEPRAVSAKAMQRSILLLLPGLYFREFCQQYPATALSTIHLLVDRSNELIQLFAEKKPQPKGVLIIPANPNIHLFKFYEQLMLHLQDADRVILLSDYDLEFRRRYQTQSDIESLIDNLEKTHEMILYLVESPETPLAQASFERKSQIYLTAHSDSEPNIYPLLKEKIRINIQTNPIHLILLQEDEQLPLPPTVKWLKLLPFDIHHNIKLYKKNDRQRLLRFMSGQAIGIVLGGGGLRSWAHLGALEAIVEAGIPIDMIGGTSAGAIVAAHYILHGLNKEAQAGLRELSEIARKIVSFKNLTWPTLSLFNTNEYVAKQIELFDSILIEDMPLPCFFISCNLSKNTEVAYRKGELWQAITSSTAVPAIFPPLVVNGELQVDGGILNNLPVDTMKRFLGPHGKVIAVELTRYDQDQKHYHFPPCLTTWDTWMSKLGLSRKHYQLPSMLDVFLNALLAGSAFKQEMNSQQADILIKPDLSAFGLMNVSRKQEDQLIHLGRESARKALRNTHKQLIKKTDLNLS